MLSSLVYALLRASDNWLRSLRTCSSRAFPPARSSSSKLSALAAKALLRSSVVFREAVTSSSSLLFEVSGPALTSRSVCRASASAVAFFARSESPVIWDSCWEFWSEVSIRSPPSTRATTTGSSSSAIRRVRIRQLRIAKRLRPVARRRFNDPRRRERPLRCSGCSAPSTVSCSDSAPPPTACSPGLVIGVAWWGPATGSRDSGSPTAPLPLLKRPCTGVATSGPGAPTRLTRMGRCRVFPWHSSTAWEVQQGPLHVGVLGYPARAPPY